MEKLENYDNKIRKTCIILLFFARFRIYRLQMFIIYSIINIVVQNEKEREFIF